VAKDNGKVVGFSGYKTLSEHIAKTELMVVDNQTRGQRIGYSLQMRRMEDMLNKGIRELITNADLPSSINWYKKYFGYKEIGKLKKIHEFGNPNIDEWTTLQVDLLKWDEERKRKK
jgi:ribosomal-protein-alanine N-acetyltransferase